MSGNPVSAQPDLGFLLDESLAPRVAEALRAVGYDIEDVATVFDPDGTGRSVGITDQEIIEWCRKNDRVWIHADDRARKEHAALLLTSGIRTLWLFRPGGRMAAREQLRILAFVLPKLLERYEARPRTRHYRATATNPVSTPSLRAVELRSG